MVILVRAMQPELDFTFRNPMETEQPEKAPKGNVLIG